MEISDFPDTFENNGLKDAHWGEIKKTQITQFINGQWTYIVIFPKKTYRWLTGI